MHALRGGCNCGNIRLELSLSQTPAAYAPRACDCDFCRKHVAAYVSDPAGALTIRIRDAALTERHRQGSAQAEFLLCTRCGVLTAVLYKDAGRTYAAVNARACDATGFGAEQSVSPKKLAPGQKSERWRALWFPDVSIATEG
jgi:hypothetical protein